MFTSIKRDAEKARKSDGGNFITHSGAYVVFIGQVAAKQTKSDSSMIELTLRDVQTGALCNSRLVLTKSDGSDAFGMGLLHALMTIVGVEEVQTVAGKVWRRDHTSEDGYRIPILEKKQVGVLLQRVNDVYNGRTKFDMNIVGWYDPQTRKTASEIVNGVEKPVKLDQKLKGLQDRDTDDYKAFTSQDARAAQPTSDYVPEVPAGYDDAPF